MDLFETSAINLSMKSSMGQQLTANVYTVEGVYNTDGSLRELSMGQLVMAICLNRATELEAVVVSLMETLARQSANIEALSKVQEKLLEQTGTSTYSGQTLSPAVTYYNSSNVQCSSTSTSTILSDLGVSTSGTYDDVIKAVDDKLDELNSLSQETLIDIQSKTSKRDDTYNLISNVLKSINTTLTGNVNNL